MALIRLSSRIAKKSFLRNTMTAVYDVWVYRAVVSVAVVVVTQTRPRGVLEFLKASLVTKKQSTSGTLGKPPAFEGVGNVLWGNLNASG